MFVIVSCKNCGGLCEPSIQFIPESDFDNPLLCPGDDVYFEMCEVYP